MATLEDIARALGTTKGTVSKALRGASDVSETMRNTVLEKAVELGYTKITTVKSGKICIFIENMLYDAPGDFGYDIIEGFRKMAEPAGYTVDIIPLTSEMQASDSLDSYLLLHDYKGAFFLGLSYSDAWSSQLQTSRSSVVLLDYAIKNNPHVATVGVDCEEAMSKAVSYLKSLGHTKIGYLSAALGSYAFQRRYLAFFHALKQHHLPAEYSQAKHVYHLTSLLGNALPFLISQGCTAIICSHDDIAHAVLSRCRENGISVPNDLSVIGHDDLLYSQHCFPPLTTVRQDRSALGKSAFSALSCQISGIPVGSLLLHPELIIRKSASKPKSL